MTSSVAEPRTTTDTPRRRSGSPGAVFATTQWTAVLQATGSDSSAHAALSRLCQLYWFPLYGFVRRQGYAPHDAQDLTQAFFARLLEKNWILQVDPKLGRFRSFLLASLKHFIANERAKGNSLKRGGTIPHLALPLDTAEHKYGMEPAEVRSPEKAYDRQWALALLEQALDSLRTELESAGKAELFETLKDALGGDRQSVRYADLGERLGLSETAVKVTVHRLRKRYREILRSLVTDTLSAESDVDEELRHLQAALIGG